MPYASIDDKRAYQREWYQRRHAQEIAAIGGGDARCQICGSRQRLVKHHLDPAEKSTHKTETRRAEVREAERDNCIVLCKRCHDRLHGRMRTIAAQARHAAEAAD